MSPPAPPHLRPLVSILAAVTLTASGACISNPGPRESARAEVSGPDGIPVRVITSTEFTQSRSGGTADSLSVQLVSADTSVRKLPFEVSADITETRRYLVRVSMASETDSVAGSGPIDTSVLLFVDGDRETEATGDLRQTSVQVAFQSLTNQ